MDAEIEELCKFFLSLNKKEETPPMNEEKLIILADENIFQVRTKEKYFRIELIII